MSGHQFENTIKALTYTNIPKPPFIDKFHEVRQMIDAFNKHMMEIFVPSWVPCIDESMSIWTSKWTCPGWMFVPRKPHDMGNKYHSVCCSMSGIMWAIKLVYGKDTLPQRERAEHAEKGKTVGLLLRITKAIHGSGKVVILDSGFCVLEGIVHLWKVGVYASALIKKRRYWPKYIKGDDIKSYFATKVVGASDRLTGLLHDAPIDVFCQKEPNYTMMLMSTYGSLRVHDNERTLYRTWGEGAKCQTTTFKYTEVVSKHYRYRGSVDDHNNISHNGCTKDGLSVEGTWHTPRWAKSSFCFYCVSRQSECLPSLQILLE